MFGRNKKTEVAVDFTVTKNYGSFQVDEGRHLIRVKENFKSIEKQVPFSLDEITDIEIQCDDNTVSKKNLGAAFTGAALFGPAGMLLAGTHDKQYITYLGIVIKTKNLDRPIIKLPLVTAKTKKDGLVAKTCLDAAEKFVQIINILKGDN